jgi:hypothetical protein
LYGTRKNSELIKIEAKKIFHPIHKPNDENKKKWNFPNFGIVFERSIFDGVVCYH